MSSNENGRAPTHWKRMPLGEVVDILDSRRVPVNAKEREGRPGSVPYYGATGQVGWIDDHLFDEELVLLGEDGAPFFDSTKQKAYLVRGRSWVNNHAHVLRTRNGMPSAFLKHQLDQVDYRPFVSGTTRAKLPQGPMRQIGLLVPPVDEQELIVAAIDSHFSRLDAATATLERVQRNLERYRASVLKAAVEGRLVPTEAELAKKEGRSYEPASVLLKRIIAERRRRWEEAELAKLKAKGKTPTDDRWKAKYEEPATPDSAGLPELPEGWCWTTSASLFWDAGYGTSGKCTPDSMGPPVLRIPNVQDQALDLSALKFAVDRGTLAADGAVEPGDFLFIRTNGSVNLIGRGAVVVDPPPRECFFASYLIRLRLARVEGLWRWFAFAWHTSVVRDQLVRDAASSAGQHNVSLSAARNYLIPLPPAHEQQRIMAEVDRLDTGRGSAAQDTKICRDRIDRLRQSILKWAFEGRLVDGGRSDNARCSEAQAR